MYLLQTGPANCGPTAIVNARIWLGESLSKKDIRKLTKTLKAHKGMNGLDLGLALAELDLRSIAFKSGRNKANSVIKHLDAGHGLVLGYRLDMKLDAHVIFVYKKGRKYFLANPSRDGHLMYDAPMLRALIKNSYMSPYFFLLFK